MALKTKKGAKSAKSEAKTDQGAPQPENTGRKRPPLNGVISSLEKEYGKGVIQRAGEVIEVNFIPTGIIGLDMLLGGGVAEGRIYEVYGPESSGKTTLATLMAASYQRKGESVAMIDVEQAYHKQYAKDLGFDVDNTELAVFSQPDSAEQALSIVERLATSGSIGLTVVDSVAALTPQKELDGDMGDSHVGLQARLMGQALRKITGIVSKNRNTVVFINQLRMKIGVMYGNPETTSGGNALKFYASTRLDVRFAGKINQDDGTIGSEVRVKVIKNKVAGTAFSERTFKLYWGAGYDKIGDLIAVASEVGVIRKAGAYFYNGEVKLGQGITQASNNLAQDEEQLRSLLAKTVEVLVERRKLPKSYLNEIDFVLEGMKGGRNLLTVAKAANDEEETEEEAAS